MHVRRLSAVVLLLPLLLASCSKGGSKSVTAPTAPITSSRNTKVLIEHNYDLLVRDLATSITTPATADSYVVQDYNGQFTDDGQHIVYEGFGSFGTSGYRVFAMDLDGGNRHTVIDDGAIGPCGAVSSTGQVVGQRWASSTSSEIIVNTLAGATVSNWTLTGRIAQNALWTNAGTQIAYLGAIYATNGQPKASEVFLVNPGGGSLTPLTSTSDVEGFIRWSPAGNKVLVGTQFVAPGDSTAYGMTGKLYVLDAASHVETFLADIDGVFPDLNVRAPACWSADGATVFYIAATDQHIHSIPATGGASVDVSQAPASFPCVSSGGTKLAYTQGTSVVVCNLDGSSKQFVYTSPSGKRPSVRAFY